VNLMWQPGETIGFTAADHVEAIHRHAGRKLIDFAIVNDRAIRPHQRRKYAAQEAQPVLNDLERLKHMRVKIIGADLLSTGATVRHDPEATAAVAVELARKARMAAVR
jgi:uncharacterized cofD-like protein